MKYGVFEMEENVGKIVNVIFEKNGYMDFKDYNNQREFGIFTLEHDAENVKYWDFYGPSGTLACDALNIPNDVIESANAYLMPVSKLIKHCFIENKKINLGELGICIHEARIYVERLIDYKPFSYIDKEMLLGRMNYLFDLERITEVTSNQKFINAQNGDLLNFLSHLIIIGYCLPPFQRIAADTIDLVDSERKHSFDVYSQKYGEIITKNELESPLDPGIADIAIRPYIVNGKMVMRSHFTNYYSMLKYDFHNGLQQNHIPVKCSVCGRYFLSTDNRATKYCNDKFPGDPKGRTCRQIANAQGTAMRELAEDNPRLILRNKAIDRARWHRREGHITDKDFDRICDLIKDKCFKASFNNNYFKKKYASELEYESLITELKIKVA